MLTRYEDTLCCDGPGNALAFHVEIVCLTSDWSTYVFLRNILFPELLEGNKRRERNNCRIEDVIYLSEDDEDQDDEDEDDVTVDQDDEYQDDIDEDDVTEDQDDEDQADKDQDDSNKDGVTGNIHIVIGYLTSDRNTYAILPNILFRLGNEHKLHTSYDTNGTRKSVLGQDDEEQDDSNKDGVTGKSIHIVIGYLTSDRNTYAILPNILFRLGNEHKLHISYDKDGMRKFVLDYEGKSYADVGILNESFKHYRRGIIRKVRQYDDQKRIIKELLPKNTIEEIVLAVNQKKTTLSEVYNRILHQIILRLSYRQYFLPGQLETADYIRSISRDYFPSKPRNTQNR